MRRGEEQKYEERGKALAGEGLREKDQGSTEEFFLQIEERSVG